VIFIYKELVKKYLNLLTVDHIKKYATSINEPINNQEATIIYNHIKKYHKELLEGNKSSLTILKQKLRPELFKKIVQLYNDAQKKYL